MNQLIEIDDDIATTHEKTNMVMQMTRAEIDTQISTAHKFPRSLTKVARNILSLATISQAAADKCSYALPRGGKPITGPSIRLAEIVFSQWGNCRGGARVVHVDKENGFVEAEGIFHDLETNAATTKRVRRRILDKNGRVFTDDMIIVTGNAACSIALRNAILGGVPEAVWDEAYQAALKTMRGDTKTLPERKEQALKAMAAFGLSDVDCWAILGIDGDRDCTLDHLVTLGQLHNALKEGETTAEQLREDVGVQSAPTRKRGNVTSKESPKTATEKPKDETPHDQETGEVVEEKTDNEPSDDDVAKAKAKMETEARFQNLANTIESDLLDAPNVDEVVDLYSDQLAEMKAAVPDLYAATMKKVDSYR